MKEYSMTLLCKAAEERLGRKLEEDERKYLAEAIEKRGVMSVGNEVLVVPDLATWLYFKVNKTLLPL